MPEALFSRKRRQLRSPSPGLAAEGLPSDAQHAPRPVSGKRPLRFRAPAAGGGRLKAESNFRHYPRGNPAATVRPPPNWGLSDPRAEPRGGGRDRLAEGTPPPPPLRLWAHAQPPPLRI